MHQTGIGHIIPLLTFCIAECIKGYKSYLFQLATFQVKSDTSAYDLSPVSSEQVT